FNPSTTIKYALPSAERVNITIYNALGQKVKTLVNKHQDAGYYTVVWDGSNDVGEKVGSGIYFYVVKAGKHRAIKKMLLVK
ncbi:MAG: T9SS C-terminal target domain-containing protein, partial [Calditrichaeota bacterium]